MLLWWTRYLFNGTIYIALYFVIITKSKYFYLRGPTYNVYNIQVFHLSPEFHRTIITTTSLWKNVFPSPNFFHCTPGMLTFFFLCMSLPPFLSTISFQQGHNQSSTSSLKSGLTFFACMWTLYLLGFLFYFFKRHSKFSLRTFFFSQCILLRVLNFMGLHERGRVYTFII